MWMCRNVLLLCACDTHTHTQRPITKNGISGKMVIQTHSLIRVIFLTLFQLKTIRSSSVATNKTILVKEMSVKNPRITRYDTTIKRTDVHIRMQQHKWQQTFRNNNILLVCACYARKSHTYG